MTDFAGAPEYTEGNSWPQRRNEPPWLGAAIRGEENPGVEVPQAQSEPSDYVIRSVVDDNPSPYVRQASGETFRDSADADAGFDDNPGYEADSETSLPPETEPDATWESDAGDESLSFPPEGAGYQLLASNPEEAEPHNFHSGDSHSGNSDTWLSDDPRSQWDDSGYGTNPERAISPGGQMPADAACIAESAEAVVEAAEAVAEAAETLGSRRDRLSTMSGRLSSPKAGDNMQGDPRFRDPEGAHAGFDGDSGYKATDHWRSDSESGSRSGGRGIPDAGAGGDNGPARFSDSGENGGEGWHERSSQLRVQSVHTNIPLQLGPARLRPAPAAALAAARPPQAPPQAGPPQAGPPPAPARPPQAPLVQAPAWVQSGCAAGPPRLVELWDVQPSFIAIVGRYLGWVVGIYLAVAVLLGVVAIVVDSGQWPKLVLVLLTLSGVALVGFAYLRSATTRLSLRAGRLDIDRGVLRRELIIVDLRRLRRVTLDQTFLQQLTDDGTLVFELVDRPDPISVTGLARGPQLYLIYNQLAALTVPSFR
jgi:hypothetical protein